MMGKELRLSGSEDTTQQTDTVGGLLGQVGPELPGEPDPVMGLIQGLGMERSPWSLPTHIL